MSGYIGINNTNKPDRLSFLKTLGGKLSPNGDFIFLPGELPDCLQHLSHEWQSVKQAPDWAE